MVSLPKQLRSYRSGPGCTKPMTTLVNVSLKFQTSISILSKNYAAPIQMVITDFLEYSKRLCICFLMS